MLSGERTHGVGAVIVEQLTQFRMKCQTLVLTANTDTGFVFIFLIYSMSFGYSRVTSVSIFYKINMMQTLHLPLYGVYIPPSSSVSLKNVSSIFSGWMWGHNWDVIGFACHDDFIAPSANSVCRASCTEVVGVVASNVGNVRLVVREVSLLFQAGFYCNR